MKRFNFPSDSKSPTGEYQFAGVPRNLQIRVELNYIGTSFGNLPSFSQFAERLAERTQKSYDIPQTSTQGQGGEAVTVKWQQKINQPNLSNLPSSSRQQPETTNEENTQAEQENTEQTPPPSDPRPHQEDNENEPDDEENRPVHHMVPKPLPRILTSAQSRIFTYIDGDQFVQERKSGSNSANVSDENPTIFRPRKVAPLSTATIRHPVRENPTPEQHKKQQSFAPSRQKMFIMGYFGAWNESYNIEEERILCEIEVFGQRILRISPDQGTYNLETAIGHYRYSFKIENFAEFDEIRTDLLREEDQMSEIAVDDQFKFQLPEKQTTFLEYLVNIEEARNFPFDGLYIEYELDLPTNFQTTSEDQNSGRTQLCFTCPVEESDVARFSFPFEVSITYKDESLSDEPFRWPRLLFRVLAEDQWQRYYVAGYGSIALPTTPIAGQKARVECWRPVNPYSSLCKLREQFIGQAVDLQKTDSSFSRMALTDNTKIFSKIGISAETSGTISLSISCMRQSRHYISQEVIRTLRYGRFITQIGLNSNLYYRITRVLMQFEETKRQLIRLRKQRLPPAPRGSITNM